MGLTNIDENIEILLSSLTIGRFEPYVDNYYNWCPAFLKVEVREGTLDMRGCGPVGSRSKEGQR